MELCYWWEYGDKKTRINWLNEKHFFVDTMWLKSVYLKDNFCSGVILPVREKTKQNKQKLNLFKIRLPWYDHLPCTHPAGSGI